MSEFELKKNTENELKCSSIKVINQLSSFKQFIFQKLVTVNYIKIIMAILRSSQNLLRAVERNKFPINSGLRNV